VDVSTPGPAQPVSSVAADQGLSTPHADQLLREVGPNSLPEPPRRRLTARVGEQLRDPMILLLMAAAFLTAFLHDVSNMVIIGLVVVFNTATGVVQQVRAERAMVALRRMTAPVCHVLRDGVVRELPAESLVPGDVVNICAGDIVAADGRLHTGNQLQVNQALLTGESLPVDLGTGDEVIGGTAVTRGRGTMIVTRTGAASGIGSIAALLAESSPRATPLQRRLARLSRMLVAVIGGLTAVVVLSGLVQGRPATEMVVVGLSLAVAAVPESLPAVITVALAMGAHRMARRNAVIRHLPAVETLGSVTVVATDKTGTITEGSMLAQHVWTPEMTYAVTGSGYSPEGDITQVDQSVAGPTGLIDRLLRDSVLCNDADLHLDGDAWTALGDPLEGALLALAVKGGVSVGDARATWPRTGEVPFDQHTMRMTTRHTGADGSRLTVCKGAPEAVFAVVTAGTVTEGAAEAAGELAARGYRVLAIADDEVSGAGLELVGLVAVGDPPRSHARRVVTELRQAGVRVLLVTGDHPATALTIARSVGIAAPRDRALEGDEVATGFAGDLSGVSVIARVRPEEKVAVVESLLAEGEVVAMIGDGVNDAPALRRADIGVAAGLGGSEVAKQAADLVLMDDDLSTVVAAVQEGRRIFANIRAFLTYALAGGLAEVAVMLFGPLIGLGLPLLPAQILWINLLTHGITGVAFGGEPAAPDDMKRPPLSPDESIFTARSKALLVTATAALTTTALLVGSAVSGADPQRRTAIFVVLGLGQLGVALALRARAGSRGLRERGLELAVCCAAALQIAGCYLPFLRDLLGTTSLPLGTLGPVVLTALLPGLIVALALRIAGQMSRRPQALAS